MRMLTAALLLGVTAPLAAQEISADSITVQGYAPAGPPSPALEGSERASADPSAAVGAIVLPTRSEAQLQQALVGTEDDLRRADGRLTRAGESSSRGRALSQQRRLELRQIETKTKQADKEKRKADKKVLEAEKRAVEREQRWAEQLEALDNAELEAAREARGVGVAKHQALELELQLAQKRAARASVVRGKSADAEDVVTRELEEQTLEAQREYRRLAHQLAEKEEGLSNKRLDLYKGSLED
jgi:hypothetical protein